MTNRDQRGLMTRKITHSRVLLAVYVRSDSQGFLCTATDRELGRDSDRCTRTVRGVLAEMKARGLIEILDERDGVGRRTIVLLQEPGGRTFMEHFNRTRPTCHALPSLARSA